MEESAALEVLEIRIVGLLHLAMQDLNAVEAHVVGQVDAFFDVAQLVVLELPEGIGGDADAVGGVPFGDQGAVIVFYIGGGGDGSESRECGGRENAAAGNHLKLLYKSLMSLRIIAGVGERKRSVAPCHEPFISSSGD